ncbi:hypothetical protein RYX36_004327 [Vicia faba]
MQAWFQKRAIPPRSKKTFGAGTSRAHESYDQTRFNGPKQQQRFDELMERRVLAERIFYLNHEGDYRSLCYLWRERKWTKLLKPYCNINTDILREFYANAFPSEGTPFSFSTKVAGRKIHFNRDEISEFLAAINAEANVDKISKAIMLEGRSVERNSSGVAIHYHRDDLKLESQVLLLFIMHNVRPRSHASTFIIDMAKLLHLMMTGRRIDVAWIISNEMRNVAESGKEFGSRIKSSCPLAFPGLIMGLLIASRVRLPNLTIFKIKTKKDEKYVDRYCLEKKIKKKETRESSSATLNYGDWDPRLRQAFSYTWHQNDSNHRVVLSLHDSFYRMQIQPGMQSNKGQQFMQSNKGQQFMTPDEFVAHIVWPGDRPFYQEGGWP